MKTHKLKNGLIVISVPSDEEKFVIKNYGYAGKWIEENNSKNFNACKTKLDNNTNYQILGVINKDSSDFDMLDKRLAMSFESFKSMIQAETDFLFENPYNENTEEEAFMFDYVKMTKQIVEKLLILKQND
jgi:hypothetical protein